MAISHTSLDTTPRSRKTANVMQSAQKINLDEYRASSAEDMANRAVHADTVAEFLNELLQYPFNDEDPLRPTLVTNPFEGLKDADSWDENLVTEKLVAAIVEYNMAPGFAFHRSENMADSPEIDNTGQKVDGGFFREEDVPSVANPDWANQRVPVELKSRKEGNKKDPYHDRKDGTTDADAETRTKVRGQLISYTEVIYYVQHRHALFMLLIIGRRFRLLRWDRAGTIVTKSTDYYDHPDLLCDFLWRISHLPDDKLGIDTSAVRIRPTDILYDRMDLASIGPRREDAVHKERFLGEENITDATTFRYVRDMFAESIEGTWPRYSLRVRDGDHDRFFAVGRPVFVEKGMACRGVRGYVAWEYSAEGTTRFVWLKDTWRAAYDGMKREGDILVLLRKAEIKNVPTLVCHGDVEDQITITAAWWKRKNPESSTSAQSASSHRKADSRVARMKRKRVPLVDTGIHGLRRSEPDNGPKLSFCPDCPLRVHKHYRLVVAEVCMPLEKFQNGRQLVSLVLDCVRTHSDAMRIPGLQLLHCDISGSNILIYPKVQVMDNGKRFLKWTGILADWEVSKPMATDGVKPVARQPERTGSWQFLSVNLLSDHTRPIKLPDELESLLHVLIYYSIRYLQSNMTGDETATFIDDFFDCFTVTSERDVLCGSKKSSTMRIEATLQFLPSSIGYIRVLFGNPLDFLFPLILSWFKAHYKVIDYVAKSQELRSSAQAIDAAPAPSGSGTAASVAEASKVTESADSDSDSDSDSDEREWNAMRSLEPKELDEPTDEERKKARQVQAHKHMIKVLQLAYDDPSWPEQDRDPVGDRVPRGWRSSRQPIPPSVSSMRPPAADDRGGKPPSAYPAGVERLKNKKTSAKRARRS